METTFKFFKQIAMCCDGDKMFLQNTFSFKTRKLKLNSHNLAAL